MMQLFLVKDPFVGSWDQSNNLVWADSSEEAVRLAFPDSNLDYTPWIEVTPIELPTEPKVVWSWDECPDREMHTR